MVLDLMRHFHTSDEASILVLNFLKDYGLIIVFFNLRKKTFKLLAGYVNTQI